MSNYMELTTKYTHCLNELYAQKSASAALESGRELVREGHSAHELAIPRLTLDGLADYDRDRGYVKGNVSLEWQTVSYDYERGRIFEVDALDNTESQDMAFGRLAGEFMRTCAIPELDAYRFAQLCSGGTDETQNITTPEAAIAALRAGVKALDDEDVPYENRVLFLSHNMRGLIDDLDLTKSAAVMNRFDKVVTVPQSRFITEIVLLDGTTAGQEEGGFIRGDDGSDINFMIVHKPSVLVYTKYAVSKVIPPQSNPDADAWRYAYRACGFTSILPGKSAGVYTNHK